MIFDLKNWTDPGVSTSPANGLRAPDRPVGVPGAPRGDHLSTRVRIVAMAARLIHGPPASRSTLFSAHDHGRLRSGLLVRTPRVLCTHVGLTVHGAVSTRCDRPMTQSIATPEPGCPGPHLRSSQVLTPLLPLIKADCWAGTGEDCRPLPRDDRPFTT